MHFKMSSAICFNLDQSKILWSGNRLNFHCNGHVQRESKAENERRKWRNARGRFKITNDDYAPQ